MEAKSILLSFLFGLVKKFFDNLANNVWDNLWEEIVIAVTKAERKWQEEGAGEEKKKWAEEQIMGYIEKEADLNWFERQITKVFISNVIDAVVKSMNDAMGKDWGLQVEKLQKSLEDRLPIID
jgi:UDP-galactopyranose mutase